MLAMCALLSRAFTYVHTWLIQIPAPWYNIRIYVYKCG